MVAISLFSQPLNGSAESKPGCVVSSGHSTWWTGNCPPDLVAKIKEAHADGAVIYDIQVASDGDWFLSTSVYNSGKVFNGPTKSRVSQFCETATNAGRKITVGNIKWIAFVPGTKGYIGVTVVNGEDIFFWDDIPSSLDAHLRKSITEGSKDVRSVSVGYNDSWIVAYRDGSSNWSGIPAALSTKLKASDDSRVLDSVALSPSSAEEFLANYEDGSASCVLPAAWRPEVTERVRLLQQDMQNMMEIAMMNQSANYSRQASMNAAVNASNMMAAAAAANAAATARAFQTMSSANW